MLQIRLQSQPALLALKTNNAQLNIEQPAAELDLQQPPADMTIERTPSKLTIDQTAAWESMDIKTLSKRVEECVANAHQEWLDGISRRARDGEELMRIEQGGNPIAEQGKRNSERPEKQFNIGFIPPNFSVKLNYEPGKVDIHWKVNKVVNSTKIHKPHMEYEPGNVDISLKQRQTLDIDFIDTDYNDRGDSDEYTNKI